MLEQREEIPFAQGKRSPSKMVGWAKWNLGSKSAFIAQGSVSLFRKTGKTARPFRYDFNQIPYDYTVEVRNRFKGLDLIDRVPDELWNELRDIVQGSRPSQWKRNAKKQNGCRGSPYK